MNALLIILACFSGVFAFAFGLAGVAGLLNFEALKNRRTAILMCLDHLVAGGLVSMFRDVSCNWSARVQQRRMLMLGLACGAGSIALAVLAGRT